MLIRAESLRKGDTFREDDDRPKDKAGYVQSDPETCPTEPANVHVRTTRGDWCIPRLAELYRL